MINEDKINEKNAAGDLGQAAKIRPDIMAGVTLLSGIGIFAYKVYKGDVTLQSTAQLAGSVYQFGSKFFAREDAQKQKIKDEYRALAKDSDPENIPKSRDIKIDKKDEEDKEGAVLVEPTRGENFYESLRETPIVGYFIK
jgi:hypothetical protein